MKKFSPAHSLSGFGKELKSRSFRVGGYSVFATLIVIAIAVAVNFCAQMLPAKMTQLDITANQLFSLSEQTEQIVSGLDTDVTIYWLVQSGQEDSTLGTLLDRYNAMSSHITVTKRDPDVYPTFVQQYVSGGIYNNSLIVESEQRFSYVSYTDIYTYDYTDYYSYDTNFNGESALTSALDYVTSDSLPKLYVLMGHGEQELSATYQAAVEKENIIVENLSLLTVDAVPEDADCLLINAPVSDISREERSILADYLQNGGNLLLITDPLQNGQRLTNLHTLMANYGVTAADGIVIETSQNYSALGMPYYLLPDQNYHTITSPLIESNYYVLLPLAHGLTVANELRDSLTVEELLTTSRSAYAKIAGYDLTTYDMEAGDLSGPFALGVAITEELDADTSTNIVWISSSAVTDDQTNMQVAGGNQDLFLNSLGWLCERENTIAIHAKSLSYSYLTMSSGAMSLLSWLVVGVLPLGYLMVGVVIWLRRRNR